MCVCVLSPLDLRDYKIHYPDKLSVYGTGCELEVRLAKIFL